MAIGAVAGKNHDMNRVHAIILTTQRTGSTFLVDCLRSHPDIECSGEILNGQPDDMGPSYRGPFKDVVKAANMVRRGAWYPPYRLGRFFEGGSRKVRMFKAMYNQVARPFALKYLQSKSDLQVIHLRRQNLLKVHVSTLLMDKRKIVQATAPTEAIWIRVDPQDAIASLRKARAQYDRYEQAFARHRKLRVSYEELIDGQFLQAETARRICEFFGVSSLPMKSKLMKLNPESLQDMVTNYDELAAAISKTEFADMLA